MIRPQLTVAGDLDQETFYYKVYIYFFFGGGGGLGGLHPSPVPVGLRCCGLGVP